MAFMSSNQSRSKAFGPLRNSWLVSFELLNRQIENNRLHKLKKMPMLPDLKALYNTYRDAWNAEARKAGLPQIKSSYTMKEFLSGAIPEQELREGFYKWLIASLWPDAELGFQERKKKIRAGKERARKRYGDNQSRNRKIIACAKALLADGEPRRGLAARVCEELSTSLSERQINRILGDAGV